jgi:hypothetical protein
MSDKLKKYIEDNEAHFEMLPRSGHFDRFKQKQESQFKLHENRKAIWYVVGKIAAVFLLVFGVGWLFFNLGKMQSTTSYANVEEGLVSFSDELIEAETFFTEQVNIKKEEVLAFSSSNNKATKQIMLELEKLELQYIDLREELEVNRNNAQIINAMVENYRMRLSVLEKLLEQLKRSNTIKQKHHDEIQA